MAKRRMAVILALLCFLLSAFPISAVSTTHASEPIKVNQECTLTLSYTCDKTAFENLSVTLYKIADVTADFQYELTPLFEPTGLIVNGVKTQGEWNVIRFTLESYIVAEDIEADAVAKTDASGTVCFENLKTGLYLAVVGTVTQNEYIYAFESALVALPALDTQGHWQYRVVVAPKSEMIPPGDQEIEFEVLKLWKGIENTNDRIKNIEVEIFRNGTSYTKIVLSNENHWSYRWTAKDDGATWSVMERNTPNNYTVTIEKRDHSFILTNTYTPENPSDVPKTGDTANVMLYVILMIVSGSMLVVFGILGKRKSHEENR